MTFTARLRRNTAPWHLWQRTGRLGGALHGVMFRHAAPGEYVTGPLDAAQVASLRGLPNVVLEATSVPAPADPLPIEALGHTDLMIPPEAVDAALATDTGTDDDVRTSQPDDGEERILHTPGWRQRLREREARKAQGGT